MCEEAADTLIRIERQFDAIERRYNKLIERRRFFASGRLREYGTFFREEQKKTIRGCACRSVE